MISKQRSFALAWLLIAFVQQCGAYCVWDGECIQRETSGIFPCNEYGQLYCGSCSVPCECCGEYSYCPDQYACCGDPGEARRKRLTAPQLTRVSSDSDSHAMNSTLVAEDVSKREIYCYSGCCCECSVDLDCYAYYHCPPTETPTRSPTKYPTPPPSKFPTPWPTVYPTPPPTNFPTISPTASPSKWPTPPPTKYPTPPPTNYPTAPPTKYPTPPPTKYPTPPPTTYPSSFPTPPPTKNPTLPPKFPETTPPTDSPTFFPTVPPSPPPPPPPVTNYPTPPPTTYQTLQPTLSPSLLVTGAPTISPVAQEQGSSSPTAMPISGATPTNAPVATTTSASSSSAPSLSPTMSSIGSIAPSVAPTVAANGGGSAQPSAAPSTATLSTSSPTQSPTVAGSSSGGSGGTPQQANTRNEADNSSSTDTILVVVILVVIPLTCSLAAAVIVIIIRKRKRDARLRSQAATNLTRLGSKRPSIASDLGTQMRARNSNVTSRVRSKASSGRASRHRSVKLANPVHADTSNARAAGIAQYASPLLQRSPALVDDVEGTAAENAKRAKGNYAYGEFGIVKEGGAGARNAYNMAPSLAGTGDYSTMVVSMAKASETKVAAKATASNDSIVYPDDAVQRALPMPPPKGDIDNVDAVGAQQSANANKKKPAYEDFSQLKSKLGLKSKESAKPANQYASSHIYVRPETSDTYDSPPSMTSAGKTSASDSGAYALMEIGASESSMPSAVTMIVRDDDDIGDDDDDDNNESGSFSDDVDADAVPDHTYERLPDNTGSLSDQGTVNDVVDGTEYANMPCNDLVDADSESAAMKTHYKSMPGKK